MSGPLTQTGGIDRDSAAYALRDVYVKFLDKFIAASHAYVDHTRKRIEYLSRSKEIFRQSVEIMDLHKESGFVGDMPPFPKDDALAEMASILEVQRSSYMVYMYSLFDSFLYSLVRIAAVSVPEKFSSSDEKQFLSLEGVLNYKDRSSIIRDYLNSRVRSLNNMSIVKRIEFIEKKISGQNSKDSLLDPMCKLVFASASIQRNGTVHNLLGIDVIVSDDNKILTAPIVLDGVKLSQDNDVLAFSFAGQLQSSRLVKVMYERVLRFSPPGDWRSSLSHTENHARKELEKILKADSSKGV